MNAMGFFVMMTTGLTGLSLLLTAVLDFLSRPAA